MTSITAQTTATLDGVIDAPPAAAQLIAPHHTRVRVCGGAA